MFRPALVRKFVGVWTLEASRSPMDEPKTLNDIKAKLDETYLRAETLAAPTRYDLAVSAVCDIRCPYCPRQKIRDEIRSGWMKPEAFDPVVPYLAFSHRTGLYGLGEPFLNKNFFDYLDAAHRAGSYTMTSTHGMSLDEATCRRIVESGLDEIAVSIDAATRRTFNFLRQGADFDTVVANVRRLIRLRETAGARTPRLHIACAVSRHNVFQMVPMVWLAKRLGADRLVFSNIIFVKEEDGPRNAVGTRAFRLNWAVARRLGPRLGLETLYFYQNPFPWQKRSRPIPPGARLGCPSAWGSYVVEIGGTLKPCCYLDEPLGSSRDPEGFASAFNNEAARGLRRSFLDGDLRAECRDCGMLQVFGPDHARRCLAEARAMIREAALSDGVRRELTRLVEEYEQTALERQMEKTQQKDAETEPRPRR